MQLHYFEPFCRCRCSSGSGVQPCQTTNWLSRILVQLFILPFLDNNTSSVGIFLWMARGNFYSKKITWNFSLSCILQSSPRSHTVRLEQDLWLNLSEKTGGMALKLSEKADQVLSPSHSYSLWQKGFWPGETGISCCCWAHFLSMCMISRKADELLRNKDTFLMQMFPVTQNKDREIWKI